MLTIIAAMAASVSLCVRMKLNCDLIGRTPEEYLALKLSSTNCRASSRTLPDYVIRRFNLSLARLNEPQGWTFAETPFSAIPPAPNGVPSQPKAASSKRLVKLIPGSARNWIAVSAVQQSNPQQKK